MFRLRRFVLSVVGALACLAVLAAVNPPQARADFSGGHFAAIAYSEQTGRYGYANGYHCLTEAENQAIAHCCAPDARAVVYVENGWVALAQGDNRAYGYAWSARSLLDAEARAVHNCGSLGCNPHLVLWAPSC